MSNLKFFLAEHGITQENFAGAVKTTQSTISRIIRGATLPSLELAARIERATSGFVPAASWVPDDQGGYRLAVVQREQPENASDLPAPTSHPITEG